MGVYNCKNFALLRKRFDSILNQTFRDYEFIICDDGSTNDTLKELHDIAQQDEFFDVYPEYSIVGTCADVFDDKGIWGEYKVPEKPLRNDFLWNSPFMHPTTMMHKVELLWGVQRSQRNKTMRRL